MHKYDLVACDFKVKEINSDNICLPSTTNNRKDSPGNVAVHHEGIPWILPRLDPSRLLHPSEIGSVQFRCSVLSNSLWPHGLQHTKPPCPSPSPRVYSTPRPLSRWCHPAISSSVVPFSSYLLSIPALGSFQMSQFFESGGQSVGVSALSPVLPMNIQDWFPLGWTGWISSLSKGLSRVSSNTTVQKHQYFGSQLSLYSNSYIHTWLLEKPELWLDGSLLAK